MKALMIALGIALAVIGLLVLIAFCPDTSEFNDDDFY